MVLWPQRSLRSNEEYRTLLVVRNRCIPSGALIAGGLGIRTGPAPTLVYRTRKCLGGGFAFLLGGQPTISLSRDSVDHQIRGEQEVQ